MIQPRSLSEKLLFNTVRIVGYNENGQQSFGTGFFYQHKVNEKFDLVLIVTNKHVIAGTAKIDVLFHEADDQGNVTDNSFKLTLSSYEGILFEHPDKNVDLAAFNVMPFINLAKQLGRKLFYVPIAGDIIWDEPKLSELHAVEDILMIGYPNGLWDEKNNFPLIRKGITSSHPAVDFSGQSIGVADIAAFPGSSGSPIFIANDTSYSTKKGLTLSARIVFLGVLFAGPTQKAQGQIEIQQIPTSSDPKIAFSANVMMHLGYYIKAREIFTLVQNAIDNISKVKV